ncbi:hypothetical protein [Alteraurantiacibacter palmitatis]|uniref:Uncharacterized protein n=1 Tax=Alteraurantiacibacter palmitatis TaxID=2054628 RepID=A0ABV7E848_9SPHN
MDENVSPPLDHRAAPGRAGLPIWPILAAVFLAFLLGASAMFYLSRQNGWIGQSLFSVRQESPPPATLPMAALSRRGLVPLPPAAATPVSAEVRATVERVEQVEVQTGGIDQRVAALEQRLTRLDLQSQAAAGNAARAESMLIAFAARRAIDRGQRLGFLEDQLRLRFGEARPNAVQTVIDASRDPVTLDQLLVQLDGLSASLVQTPPSAGLLTRLRYQLSQLFSVRTDDTPSPVAEQRLARARTNLENGRIERAIAEVRAMPNAETAQDWLDRAERYAAAQRALEALEAAAVYESRSLRDGDGQRVEQPGLAE